MFRSSEKISKAKLKSRFSIAKMTRFSYSSSSEQSWIVSVTFMMSDDEPKVNSVELPRWL